jgi:long-chain fatty acid transport protein
MFRQSQQLGDFTSVSLAGYWVGMGITWRPGAGKCERQLSR